jgi:hypothetical protein
MTKESLGATDEATLLSKVGFWLPGFALAPDQRQCSRENVTKVQTRDERNGVRVLMYSQMQTSTNNLVSVSS